MSPCLIICNFSVVQAAGHMFKSNPADVITSTPKPPARSLPNHKIEAKNTPVTVSRYFTITIFVTDTATFVVWYAVNSLIIHWCWWCLPVYFYILHCVKNWFKILGVKPIVDGSYCKWQQGVALLVTVT